MYAIWKELKGLPCDQNTKLVHLIYEMTSQSNQMESAWSLYCDSLRWPHTHFICIPAVHVILLLPIILFIDKFGTK